MSSLIEFQNAGKRYGGNTVLKRLTLRIEPGELVVFIGRSGGGKTTALEMINAMVMPDEGCVTVRGKDVAKTDPISLRRSIGYCVQNTSLFPHMTIAANILYVPVLLGMKRDARMARVLELLELVGLPADCLKRYPRQLSGGEAQRVGVARALAADPEIVLMDEPFGATDNITRGMLQDELVSIHARLHKTIVFVTHDLNEARKLADRIVLFNCGEIEQVGTFDDLLSAPANDYVQAFMSNAASSRDTTDLQ
jgi:osmoprotectant transport system ATP-binding protein